MSRRWVSPAAGLPLVVLLAATYLQARPDRTCVPAAQSPQSAEQQALLKRYCVSCHNEKLKAGDFVLSTLDVNNVGAHGERWERVVRKLRARAMPPAGRPRPTEGAYDGLIAHLE